VSDIYVSGSIFFRDSLEERIIPQVYTAKQINEASTPHCQGFSDDENDGDGSSSFPSTGNCNIDATKVPSRNDTIA